MACGKVVVTANGCNAHPSNQSMWHLVHQHRASAWRYASRCFSPEAGRLGGEVSLQMPSRRKTHSVYVLSSLGITRMSDAEGLSADAVRVAPGAAMPPRRATMKHHARRYGSSFRSTKNDGRMSSIRRQVIERQAFHCGRGQCRMAAIQHEARGAAREPGGGTPRRWAVCLAFAH